MKNGKNILTEIEKLAEKRKNEILSLPDLLIHSLSVSITTMLVIRMTLLLIYELLGNMTIAGIMVLTIDKIVIYSAQLIQML